MVKGRLLLLFVNVSFFGVHAYAQGDAELELWLS